MASDELTHHLKLNELHTWWYRVDVRPCVRCPHVCAFCSYQLQLQNGVLDLAEYNEEQIREVSEFMKRQGLRFSVEQFLREWVDEGDR